MLNLFLTLLIIMLVVLQVATCAYYRTILNKRNKTIDKYRNMWLKAGENAFKNYVDAICWRAAKLHGLIGNQKEIK